MFDVYCPECASRRLIFSGQVSGIDNDAAGGIVVHFSCWCGAQGAWRTGSGAGREAVAWKQSTLAG